MYQGLTDACGTFYYYHLNNEPFFQALPLFLQLIANPTFDIQAIEREIDAVHSEYMQHVDNFVYQAMRVTLKNLGEGSALNSDRCGNKTSFQNR
jgi:secreted Zn-dependent insulinase-like peptidase